MAWLDDALTLEAAGQIPDEWAADLATLRAAGDAPARSTEAAVPAPAEQPAPAPAAPVAPADAENEPGFLRNAAATAVEVGAPIAGSLVGGALGLETGPGALVTAAAGGAAGGALGRKAADWIRGKETSTAGLVSSAVLGAIPGGAAAKVGGGVVKQTLAHALEGGVIGAGSELVRHGIEEGRLPTGGELALGTGVGAVTGGAIGGVSSKVAQNAEEQATLAAEYAASKAAGTAAPVEAKVAEQLPLPGIKVEQQAEKLGAELGATTPEGQVQFGLFDATGHVRDEIPPVIDHASGEATGRMTQAVKNEGEQAAELLAATEPGQKNERLYKQVAAAFHTGMIDAPGLVEQLKETGMSLPEFVKDYYVPSIRLAGQQLQQLSSLRKHIASLGGEGKAAIDELSNLSASVKFTEWIQRLEDTRRTLLISQVKTGVRNAESQGITYGTDLLEQGMRQAVGGRGDFFGSIASLSRAWNKDESRTAIQSLLKGRSDLLEKLGEHEYRPPNTFLETNPVLRATLGKFVNVTTWINQAQEQFFRRATFDSSLRQSLKNAGYDVEAELAANLKGVPEKVRGPMLDHAVDRALELTFAQTAPGGKFSEKMIEGLQTARPLTTFVTPFPRYMGNALAYVVKRSPLGLARLATTAGRQDYGRVMSEAMTGNMLLGGAIALRYSAHGGEKWYQIKRDNGEEYDIRGVLGPFAPYLFAADAVKQYLDKGTVNYKGSDVIEGILSMSRLTGTASTMLSWLKGDANDSETWAKGAEKLIGEWVGGFSTPARNVKDAFTIAGSAEDALGTNTGIGKFGKAEGTFKDIRDYPLSGPTRQNIPGADQSLPDSVSVTRGEPMPTEHPIPSGILGLNIRSTTPLENEMERLNVGIGEVAPKTGYPKADRELSRRIGKIVSVAGPRLVKDAGYQKLGEETKKVVIRQLFTEAKKLGMSHLEKSNPKVWAVLKAHGELTPEKKAKFADAGIDVGGKLQEILDKAPEGGSVSVQQPSKPGQVIQKPDNAPAPAATGKVVENNRVTPEAVNDVAELVGLPPALLTAVMKQESRGGRVDLTSYQDAHGPMQMLPTTFNKDWKAKVEAITGKSASVDDPMDNLIAGALMYRQLLEEHGGNVEEAARFYHGGPNTRIHGPKTRDYGRIVARNYRAAGA